MKAGWGFPKEELCGFLQDQGIFVVQALRQLSNSEKDKLYHIVAEFFSDILEGLLNVAVVRGNGNEAINYVNPPLLPQELVSMKPRKVAELYLTYQIRLSQTWSTGKIERIGEQHKSLLLANEREARLKSAIGKLAGNVPFNEAWSIPGLQNRFPDLVEFLGGLATPFPNTATVESDFSILKWEKDDYRSSLTSFSLEGILHCRQFFAKSQ